MNLPWRSTFQSCAKPNKMSVLAWSSHNHPSENIALKCIFIEICHLSRIINSVRLNSLLKGWPNSNLDPLTGASFDLNTCAHTHIDTCTEQQWVNHILTKSAFKCRDTDQCFALTTVGWRWRGECRPLTCSLNHSSDLLCAWDAASLAASNLSVAGETLWCREERLFK